MQPPAARLQRRWSNRHVHREHDPRRSRWLRGLVIGVALAVTPFAVYIHQQNRCVKLTYELDELRTERNRLLVERRRLLARRAMLESPAAVEPWAQQELGLVRPQVEQLIVVPLAQPQRPEFVAHRSRGRHEVD